MKKRKRRPKLTKLKVRKRIAQQISLKFIGSLENALKILYYNKL
jgi:hypothetical protein